MASPLLVISSRSPSPVPDTYRPSIIIALPVAAPGKRIVATIRTFPLLTVADDSTGDHCVVGETCCPRLPWMVTPAGDVHGDGHAAPSVPVNAVERSVAIRR